MPKPKVVRHFTPEFYRRHSKELSSIVEKRLSAWGAHGFRIAGKPPRLRVEIVVAQTVQRPPRPVDPIQVGSLIIKPQVRSSHVTLRRLGLLDGSNLTAVGVHAVAPGARIRVGRNQVQEIVGIAAVVKTAGKPAILTCGHAQAFSFSDELLAGDEPDGEAIARVDVNLLAGSTPLDAALCPLTDAGVALLQASSSAPTWRFKTVRSPSATDNGKSAVFFQTHDGDDSAPTADVGSFSSTSPALFGPAGPSRGFIETGHNVVAGDSGSLLAIEDSLYGICSGFVGLNAFFTPISGVLAALSAQGIKCSIFQP